MAKVRVYELAKEFGVESKAVMAKLQEMGEFVRSASSTIEAPVVRRLKEAFSAEAQKQGPAEKVASRPTAPAAGENGSRTAPAGPAAAVDGAAAPAPPVTPAPPVSSPSAPAGQPGPDGGTTAPARAPGGPATPPPVPFSDAPPASTGGAGRPARASRAPAQPAAGRAARRRPVRVPVRRGPAPRARARGPATTLTARPRPAWGCPSAGRPAPARQDRPIPVAGPRPGGRVAPGPRAADPAVPARPTCSGPVAPVPAARGRARAACRRVRGPGGPGRGGPGGPGRGGPGGAGAGPARAEPAAAPVRALARAAAPAVPPGPVWAAAVAVPAAAGVAAAAPRARSGVRAGAPRAAASRASSGARSSTTCRRPRSAASRSRAGTARSIRLSRGASLSDFADKIGVNPASLVQVLFHLGEMVTATQSVNDETLQLLGAELNYNVQVVSPEEEDRELLESFHIEFGEDEGEDADLQPRPPVVTVMGHVDHGKTKLLDAIRHANVVAREAGGITQHIGAYQVTTEVDGADRKITFIDTPGHEAFTAMRARGAETTDLVVLVVAADDGVKPQTTEALNHAQAAGVPIVVAVNKIDKEGADPARVRSQLTEYGLVAEEFGGTTLFVDVSARESTGIAGLLEAIVLTADAELDLRANPDQDAQGVAIETHLDKGRGPVATVLVQRGTLNVGDSIVCGDAFGRVRALLDENSEPVPDAPPSRPVQVLGLNAVPNAGDNFLVVSDERVARQIAERREARERSALFAQRRPRVTLEDLESALKSGEREELLLIIKGDVSGSVEALEDALLKIDVGEDVVLRVIGRGVGAITQDDVNLAIASDAVIVGFNVRPAGRAGELAQREGVEIRYYSVIYQAIDEIEAALKGMLKPEFEEAQLGTAEIREVFRVPRIGNVAGCIVRSGTINRGSKARLIRDGVVVSENLSVDSLRRFKEDVTEVREGYECGIGIGYSNINVGDTIETYEMREKPRA